MGFVVDSRLVLLVKLCAIGLIFIIQGSSGFSISPTQGNEIHLTEGVQSPVHQIKPFESNPPSSESLLDGPTTFDTPPESISGQAPFYQPSPVGSPPPYSSAPPPVVISGSLPPESPTVSFTPTSHGIVAPSPGIFQGSVAPLPSKADEGSVSLDPPLPSIAPPPQISGGNVAPVPSNSVEGHVAPMPSNSSGGVLVRPPAHSIVPPPQISQGQVAPMPSNSNGGNVSLAPPPKSMVSPPQISQGQPAPSPSSTSGGGVSLVPPPHNTIAPPPQKFDGHVAPMPSNDSGSGQPGAKAPASVPVATPPANSSPSLPSTRPGVPETSPGSTHQNSTPFNGSPLQKPVSPAAALPPRILVREKPMRHPIAPAVIIPSVSPGYFVRFQFSHP